MLLFRVLPQTTIRLDYAYNTLKQHGRDHRLFDGSHDLVGAWKAITEHVPEEAWLKKAEGYVMALWKDVATPNGLPVATWNKEAFDKTAGFLEQTLGISRSWTKDMVSFTGTELMGATNYRGNCNRFCLEESRYSQILGDCRQLGAFRCGWSKSRNDHHHNHRTCPMFPGSPDGSEKTEANFSEW